MGRLARVAVSCFTAFVALPYKISTLLYCFNEREEMLLLERRKKLSRGCWSRRRCYKESGLGRESGLQGLAAQMKPT